MQFIWHYRLLSDFWQRFKRDCPLAAFSSPLPVAIISYYLCNMRILFTTNSQILRPRFEKSHETFCTSFLRGWGGGADRVGVAVVRLCELIYELGVNFWHMTYLGGGRGERSVCCLVFHIFVKRQERDRDRKRERENRVLQRGYLN